jgi:hypothetical protein
MQLRAWSRQSRVRDADAIAIDAIPQLLTEAPLPLSEYELAVIVHVDGLRSVLEIARCACVPLTVVRTLLLEVAWAGSLRFDELIEVDEIDLLGDGDDEDDADAVPLVRRREPACALIDAVLRALTEMTIGSRSH